MVFLTRRTLSIAPAQAITKTAAKFPQAGNHARARNVMRFKSENVAGMFMMWAFDRNEGPPSETCIPRRGQLACRCMSAMLKPRPPLRAG
ncbi:hypothetical protein C7G43_32615 [Bradyrhizobium sp. MOS004]|nr:hypothetical protein C7G43_32615 [Bradyrhizobium sp. MOS004]